MKGSRSANVSTKTLKAKANSPKKVTLGVKQRPGNVSHFRTAQEIKPGRHMRGSMG